MENDTPNTKYEIRNTQSGHLLPNIVHFGRLLRALLHKEPRLAEPHLELASLLLDTTSAPLLTLGLVLQGVARSSLMTVAILTLVETRGVGEKHAGTASGLFFSFAEIGGAGGPIVLGVLYDATGGFDAGLYLLAGIGALLAVAAMGLRRIGR